jgi:hypothetical protein
LPPKAIFKTHALKSADFLINLSSSSDVLSAIQLSAAETKNPPTRGYFGVVAYMNTTVELKHPRKTWKFRKQAGVHVRSMAGLASQAASERDKRCVVFERNEQPMFAKKARGGLFFRDRKGKKATRLKTERKLQTQKKRKLRVLNLA